ncbi:hypothetical protein ACWDG9_37435, partial [Streptomyces sp. NPDC001073]
MAAWIWRFEKSDGTEVEPAVQPEEFTTQGDAESWLGEVWKDLVAGTARKASGIADLTQLTTGEMTALMPFQTPETT